MLDFYEWMNQIIKRNQLPRPSTPGKLATQDYSHLDLRSRIQQGRDIGEPIIIANLKQHGIDIEPSETTEDKQMKIDGFWNGKPVQLKLRNTGKEGRNDIAYEVCRNHDRSQPLKLQLRNVKQQGRDYFGKVAYYFVLDRSKTNIAQVPGAILRAAVMQAINELDRARGGVLQGLFQSSTGIELMATKDNDPGSFTPFKVMAFVPVALVAEKNYPIQKVA